MIVKDVIELSVKDAVAIRFKELCDQRGIRPNELAVRSGVTPVSYTHLDVYKRQAPPEKMYLRNPLG